MLPQTTSEEEGRTRIAQVVTDGVMADDEESLPMENTQKRGRGRPRIHPMKVDTPKRPRGRPKKPESELARQSPEVKRPRGRPRKDADS